MLHVRDLHVGHGTLPVLRGVSLSVAEGEIVTVLGANGAGKTTLLKAIAGLLSPTRGVVEFDGQVMTGKPADAVTRLGLCTVPEGRQTFGGLTVIDNLMLGAQFGGRERPSAAQVRELLAEVFGLFPRLKERQAQRARTLSGGEGQMLAIGRALMCRPRLLMLDEPSLGLAPLLVREIFEVVKRLAARMPILLVEQNAQGALQVADRAYVLETGSVALHGAARDLLQDTRVQEHYLGTAAWRARSTL